MLSESSTSSQFYAYRSEMFQSNVTKCSIFIKYSFYYLHFTIFTCIRITFSTLCRKDILDQLYSADDILSFEKVSFREFTKKQPSVLFLAFTVQKSIIRGLIGNDFWRKQLRKRMKLFRSEIDAINQLREDIISGKFVAPLELQSDTYDEDLMTAQLNKDKPASPTKQPSFNAAIALNTDTSVKVKSLEKQLSAKFTPGSPSKSQKNSRPASDRNLQQGSAKNTRPKSGKNIRFEENVIQVSSDNSSSNLIPVGTDINPELIEIKAKKGRKRMEYKGTVNSEQVSSDTEIVREKDNDSLKKQNSSEKIIDGIKKQNSTKMIANGDKFKDINDKNLNVNNDNIYKLDTPGRREKKVLDDLNPSPVHKKSRKRVAYKGSTNPTLGTKSGSDKSSDLGKDIGCSSKQDNNELVNGVSVPKDSDREGLVAFNEAISNAIDSPQSKVCTKSPLKTSTKDTVEDTNSTKVKSKFTFNIGEQLRIVFKSSEENSISKVVSYSSKIADSSFSKVASFSSKIASRPILLTPKGSGDSHEGIPP